MQLAHGGGAGACLRACGPPACRRSVEACPAAPAPPHASRRRHHSTPQPAFQSCFTSRQGRSGLCSAAPDRSGGGGGGGGGGGAESLERDGGGGASGSLDKADSLASVQDRLSLAVAAEDYTRAAQLRDELGRRTQDGREAVLAANQRFYDAFQSCSPQAMAGVWGEGDHVQCIHPVSGIIAGREDVLASWHMVLGAGGSVNIRLDEVRVALLGERSAYVTCTELINATDNRGRIAATNVFEKQNGEWRIVHHHGSPSPPPAG